MITVEDTIHDYMGSQAFKRLAYSTQKVYEHGLKRFKKYFGANSDVKNITPRNAERFFTNMCHHHDEKMAMRYLCGPTAAMNYLVALRDLTFNPFSVLSTNPNYDDRNVVWTEAQRKKFYEIAKQDPERAYMSSYVDFLYISAQRVDEPRLFRYEDIKTDETGDRYFPVSQEKTSVYAPVWITERMFKEFEDIEYPNLPESGYMFIKNGNRLTYQTIHSDFIYLRKKAELPNELQLRDLRRSRATDLMATNKYVANEVMALTGHTNERVFRKVYVVLPKDKTKWMLKE